MVVKHRRKAFQPAGGGADIMDSFSHTAYGGYSFSRRLYSAATQAFELREDGGDTLADIGFDGDGNIDSAAIASHLGANNGYIRTIYDQSPAGIDLVQTTNSKQGQLVVESGSGKYMMKLVSANSQFYQSASSPVRAQPTQYFIISDSLETSSAVQQRLISSKTISTNRQIVYAPTSNAIGLYAGGGGVYSSSTGKANYSLSQMSLLINGSSSDLRIDGATDEASPPTASVPGSHSQTGLTLGANLTGASAFFWGHVGEVVYVSGLSSGNRDTLETDQSSWYGTP